MENMYIEFFRNYFSSLFRKSPLVDPPEFYESLKKPIDLSRCGNTASPIFSNPEVKKAFFELQKKDLSSKV